MTKAIVKKGQTYNEVCPFTGEQTEKQVQVVEVKPAANGKPAALVRVVSSTDQSAIGYEFGIYVVDGGLLGYEEDVYSVSDDDDFGVFIVNEDCSLAELEEETTIKTFKNTSFSKRNYETTNIVFCQSEKAPGDNWEECEEIELKTTNCTQIYMQAGVRYYGYL